MKKLLSFAVGILLLLSSFTFNQMAFAESYPNEQNKKFAQQLNISTEELNNLGGILEDGMQKIDNEKNTEQVRVSDNLFLEKSLEKTSGFILPSSLAESSSTIYNMEMVSKAKKSKSQIVKVTKQMLLKNAKGSTILTLKSVGVFEVNGFTSKPINAYASYEGKGWTVSTSSKKSEKSAKSYVKNTFKGKIKYGINPVGVNFKSFSHSNTIYCDAKGKLSSIWSK
ncbi:hypothetical protein [Bacillus sp. 179-C3.3 HS]|uniref:hypothetical protein n=1 Tax=Bacillus sp. 179-C3.3 HS TaxID=3232162 RepID=UPI00399FBAF6